ncbi:MAG: fasciclin domain-containing protein, partial [Verrucomicrobiaceae bacterium]
PENKEKLAAVLTYHVVSGKVMAADVKPGDVKTVNGATATISASGGTVMIDKSTVTKTDIAASNGVIHVIDTVMMPETK